MFEETYKLKQYGYIDEDMIPIKTINGAKFLFDNMFIVYKLNKDNTNEAVKSADEIVDGYMYGIKDEEFYDIQMTCEVFNNEVQCVCLEYILADDGVQRTLTIPDDLI